MEEKYFCKIGDKMKTMKTAIVGCGVISDVYIQSIQEKFSILELCACSDLDVSRMYATHEKYGLRSMSYDEILADPEIGMILNLTSPVAHYSLSKQALEAGKHVYSEKMLTVELEEAEKLCKIAQEKGVRLGCAPDTFLGGGIQTARYAIDRKLAGNLLSGVVSLTRDYRVFGENLPHLFKKGGSILYDMGCYYLTALCSILGRVERIFAFGKKTEERHLVKRVDSTFFGQELPVDECNVVTALLWFENGVQVTVHLNSSSILNETFHLELYGDSGIIRMGDPNSFGGAVTLEKPKNEKVLLPFTHGFQEQSRGLGAAEMAYSILAGRLHRASMEQACHVLEIVHGVLTSIETMKVYETKTNFERPQPLPEGYIGCGFWEPTEESALL